MPTTYAPNTTLIQRPDIKDFKPWFQDRVNYYRKDNYIHTEDGVVITPEIARILIYEDKNYINRGQGTNGQNGIKSNVNRLSNMMKCGTWNPNSGDPIKINSEGHLIDGGNRLNAIMLSGIPQRFSITFNCTQDAYMDSGKPRTVSENFQLLSGYQFNKRWWSSINMLWRLWKGANDGKTPHKTLPDFEHATIYNYLRENIDWCTQTFDTIYNKEHRYNVRMNDVHRATLLYLSRFTDKRDKIRDAFELMISGMDATQTTFKPGTKAYMLLTERYKLLLDASQAGMRQKGNTHEGRNNIIIANVNTIMNAINMPKKTASLNKETTNIRDNLDSVFNITETDIDPEYQHMFDNIQMFQTM